MELLTPISGRFAGTNVRTNVIETTIGNDAETPVFFSASAHVQNRQNVSENAGGEFDTRFARCYSQRSPLARGPLLRVPAAGLSPLITREQIISN